MGPTGCRASSKLVDDTEVAAATAERPKELRILRLGGPYDRSVGGYQFNREEVVAGEPTFADQMADAAAQGQAADTGARNLPARCREPVLLGGRVKCPPSGPPACQRSARLNINLDVIQLGKSMTMPSSQVEKPATTVGAPAYRDRPSFTSGKSDGSNHILGGRNAYDQCRTPVDRVIPDATGRLIVRVPGPDH